MTVFTLIAVPTVLLALLFLALVFPASAHCLAERAFESIPRLTQGNGFLSAWDLAGYMWANALRFALFGLAATTVIAIPYLRAWSRRAIAVVGSCCLMLAAIDPLQANGPFMTQADPAWLDRVPPAVDFMRSDSGVFRIGRFGRRMVLHPNLPVLYGLHDTGGYDSIILAQYARYLEAIEPQRSLWFNQVVGFQDPDSLDSPLLRLLNIRFLLADDSEQIDHPDWELIFRAGVNIYRNRREMPRAFMVHRASAVRSFEEAIEQLAENKVDVSTAAVVENPPSGLNSLPAQPPANPGRVSMVRYAHTAVEMTTSSAEAGLVVLCDMMCPGWRAYVDGQPADILKVNGIFRGVCVPAGKHGVAFRFEPASLRNGLILLCIGLAGMVACVAASCLPSRNKGGRS